MYVVYAIVYPRVSSQMMSGVWWVLTLVLVSWYTATLPSYLHLQPETSPIQSVEDLIRQNKINYGMVGGGSTQHFFEVASSYHYYLSSEVSSASEFFV